MQKYKAGAGDYEQTQNWPLWEHEPSEFPWYYDSRETCLILEGAATVTDRDGNSMDFEQADVVEFEKGLECTWKIVRKIKKRYKLD